MPECMQVRSINNEIVYQDLVVLSYNLVKSIINGYRFSLVSFYLFTLFEFEYFVWCSISLKLLTSVANYLKSRILPKFDEGNWGFSFRDVFYFVMLNTEVCVVLQSDKSSATWDGLCFESQLIVCCSEYSMQLNASRIKVLQAQDDVISSMKEAASKELLTSNHHDHAYKNLLKDLIVQVS